MPLNKIKIITVLCFIIFVSSTYATTSKKKKPPLPPVPRIIEKVDLSLIKNAAIWTSFMRKHSFPYPSSALSRFIIKNVKGKPYITAIFRFFDAEGVESIFKGFKAQLEVNKNLEPDMSNRWTQYTLSPLSSHKTGNGTLLYHNPDAGYTLEYHFESDFDRNLGTIIIILKPCTKLKE